MLILAGVSISAIVGDNGVLTKTTYASFLSEMSAVEEAVQLWKAGEIIEAQGDEVKAIPANGLCKANDLTSSERLVGEVGYYRVWSLTSTMPSIDILSSADNFNSSFESELVFYPAGVQDLYYLNNDALEIKGNKTYLIDATTGMIFSMTGISLKGVRCYSLNMAKAVMNGTIEQPLFAEAEMSGGGDNIIYAGETYLKDKNGNYIDENGNIVSEENKVINPNGFKIISSRSNNLYKLYNNGDLYAKGLKGTEMNTPQAEMQLIDQYSFTEWSVEKNMPEVGSYKEIIQGYQTMFVIDSKDNLWAVGSNNSNKLGLTQEQQIEYTGREAIKLDVGGKGVSKVFSGSEMTFVITTDNYLYVAGWNDYGQAGLGHRNVIYSFSKVEFFSPEQVKKISRIYANCSNDGKYTIVHIGNDENQSFYFVGRDKYGSIGNGKTQTLDNFTQIWNETSMGGDIDQDIKEVVARGAAIDILKNDGTLWHAGYRAYDGGPGGQSLSGGSSYVLQKFEPSVFGCTTDEEINIVEIYESAGIIVVRENTDGTKEYWGAAGSSSNLGLLTEIKTSKYEKITFPDEMFADNDSIKELYPINENVYYLMNSGKVWACGSIVGLGKTRLDKEKPNWIVCITKESNNTMTLPLIESVSQYKKDYNNSASNTGTILFKGKDGKNYTIGNSAIMYGNNILQSSWIKINPKENGDYIKIKSFKPNLIIDDSNNLWVAGSDARYLGLGEDTPRAVNNYEKITDSNVAGKVKEAFLGDYNIAVLTTDNKLYVSGVYSHPELYGEYCFPGWSSNDENSYTFKEITSLSNIKQLSYSGGSRFAICEENDTLVAYAWGRAFSWSPYSQVPRVVSTLNAADIKRADAYGRCSFIITTNNKLYVAGDIAAEIGMSSAKTTLTEHTYFADKEVKEVIVGSSGTKIVLTTDGKVYGWGVMNKLGIGSTSTAMKNLPEYLGLDNVEQIVAGNGWIVAIKNDGTVWGTGTNQYGILGRWMGIDRNSPNSRYKTAFDWVECPELEI